MPHSHSAAVTAVVVEAEEDSTAAGAVVDSTAVVVVVSMAVEAGASMAVEAVAAFTAAGVEDSTAVALPVAVAGFPMVADIVAATPTGACARMAAEHDLLAAEVITGAVVFGADRQQAGARTAASAPRAA